MPFAKKIGTSITCSDVARSTEKDITDFFEKSACGKAFSDFFINPYCPTPAGVVIPFLFWCEPKKISFHLRIHE